MRPADTSEPKDLAFILTAASRSCGFCKAAQEMYSVARLCCIEKGNIMSHKGIEEFIWCGVWCPASDTASVKPTSDFLEALLGKLQICSRDALSKGYILDMVVQNAEAFCDDNIDDVVRSRELFCSLQSVLDDDSLLKPADAWFGATFIQIVFGNKRFLRAVADQLFEEDGWPADIAGDVRSYTGDLTQVKNILTLVRPRCEDPLYFSPEQVMAEEASAKRKLKAR